MLAPLISAAGLIAVGFWLWARRHDLLARPVPVAIAGSAIRYCDLGTIALPLPNSHAEVQAQVELRYGSRAGKHRGEIGYITSRGGFVNGKEALVIARQARQLRPVRLRGDKLELDYLLACVKGSKEATVDPAVKSDASPRRSGRSYSGAALWMTRVAPSGQIVTKDHIARQFARTAAVTVPCLVFAGTLSLKLGSGHLVGRLLRDWVESGSSLYGSVAAMYALLGLALAMVLQARGAQLRWPAVAAFAAFVVVTLLWGVAYSAEIAGYSLLLAAAMLVLAPLTIALFGLIRPNAAVLTFPSLGWTGLATYLTLDTYLMGI